MTYHEFAHKIDMLDGMADGTPPLPKEQRERWLATVTAAFHYLRENEDPLIDGYGATNEAEFFAVITEVFFDRPVEMRDQKPDLYAALTEFYRQDPAGRVERAAAQ